MAEAKDVINKLEEIQFESFTDQWARREALEAARALVSRLEAPVDKMIRDSFEMPALNASMRVALDQGVFEKLDQDPTTPKGPEALTKNADPALLNRFLKHLVSMNIIKQAGPNLYLPTRHSSALAGPTISAGVNYYRDIVAKAFISLPDWLADNNYADPATASQDPWKFLLGGDENHFQWLSSNPAIMHNFIKVMEARTANWISWLDVYPGTILLEGADNEKPLVVDVGGGHGEDLKRYLQIAPETAGRLVLQDLPDVLERVKPSLPAGIIAQDQDFFTPQKVQGARAYLIHSCFHDWPGSKCKDILDNLRPAMQPGYSRLLINEMVITPDYLSPYGTTMDIGMLALFNSKERTEEDWTALLVGSGFKIIKIWKGPVGREAIIEAELA